MIVDIYIENEAYTSFILRKKNTTKILEREIQTVNIRKNIESVRFSLSDVCNSEPVLEIWFKESNQ